MWQSGNRTYSSQYYRRTGNSLAFEFDYENFDTPSPQ